MMLRKYIEALSGILSPDRLMNRYGPALLTHPAVNRFHLADPRSFPRTLAASLYSICRLEKRMVVPPASTKLLTASLAAYGIGEVLVLFLKGHSAGASAAGGALSILLLSAVASGALALDGLGRRTKQTLIALSAGGAVISLVHIVLLLILTAALPPPMPPGASSFLLFPLLLWNLLVFAYVFRHAFAGRSAYAFSLSLTYLLLLYVASQKLFAWTHI